MRRYMQNIHIHVSTLICIVNSVTQWLQEGWVVWTIARQVSTNDSEKLFSDPKAEDRKPLIHWQKPKHTGSKLKGYKNIHHCHSQRASPTVEQSPAPLQESGPRAQAVHRGARLYVAGNTSSGSFPTREVTFHVPTAVLNSRWLDSQSLHPWLLPNTHIYYLIMKVTVRITLSNNIHNSFFHHW